MVDEPQPAPPLWYGGQPYSKESATAKLAELDADKDFVAALLKNDIAKVQERSAFKQMSLGRQPGVVPAAPQDVAGVTAQMDERALADHERVVDSWGVHIHPTSEAREQMKRGLATKDAIEQAKESIRRAKSDPEFGRKLTTPRVGAEEKEKWAAWHFVAYRCREVPNDFNWSKADAVT